MPRPTAARLIINRKTHMFGQDLRDFVRENIAIKREAAEKKRLQGIEVYKKTRRVTMILLLKRIKTSHA
jgi:hypothetical protein